MKKILLIEDNRDIRENTVELLSIKDYHVITAVNGAMGLHMAKEQKPDLIISDIMMPEMNGHEIFDELKKDSSTKNIPFVFMTSSVEKREIDAAMQKGANGYIQKPFEDSDLFDTIERCLAEINNIGP